MRGICSECMCSAYWCEWGEEVGGRLCHGSPCSEVARTHHHNKLVQAHCYAVNLVCVHRSIFGVSGESHLHIPGCSQYRDKKNGIAVHVGKHNHQINWDHASVETAETSYWKRRVQEAICIRTNEPTMNLDCGLALSNTWLPLLKMCWVVAFFNFLTPPTIIIYSLSWFLNQLFHFRFSVVW